MRQRLFVVALGFVLTLTAPMQAVGTLTVAVSDVGAGVTKYTLAWTSNGSGAVSANSFPVRRGRLLSIKFVPASGGTQPSDLYDVTLVDTNSIDVLNGVGDNLSNATGKYALWDPPMFLDATQNLDLVVANAGSAKTGTVMLWVSN